jgi:hypothetical protein
MTLPRTVADVLAEHVVLEVESIDRMYLNAYVPGLQSAAELVAYVGGTAASSPSRASSSNLCRPGAGAADSRSLVEQLRDCVARGDGDRGEQERRLRQDLALANTAVAISF